MNEMVGQRSTGVLTYGSVELCLYQQYQIGEAIRIHGNLFMEIVDRVEKADGIIVLGSIPNEDKTRRPSCICVLFTHYVRRPFLDVVDHAATVQHLTRPTDLIRRATERAFMLDLTTRSVTASLAYTPSVRYL
jgi:hypothetical protein